MDKQRKSESCLNLVSTSRPPSTNGCSQLIRENPRKLLAKGRRRMKRMDRNEKSRGSGGIPQVCKIFCH